MRASLLNSIALAVLLSISCLAAISRPVTGDSPDLKARFHQLRTQFMEKRRYDATIPDLRRNFQAARDAYRLGNYDRTESELENIERILSATIASSSHPTPKPANSTQYPSSNTVTYLGSSQCAGYTCYTLDVTCKEIPPRGISLKKIGSSGPSGTVFLTTGGRSNMPYSAQSHEQRATVDYLTRKGYQIFEIAWEKGWPSGAEGRGFKDAMCGYEEAVRWTVANLADNKETVCAQGNSAGGFQIAYGLAVYGMEDILDLAIMSGGPPASRFDVSCFGTNDAQLQGAEWPDGSAGLGLVDIAMGWARMGDYCKSRRYSPDREKQLQDTSLVSPTEPRDYNYKTIVMFVNSVNDYSNADETAKIFYDKIQSEKYWYEIEGTDHNVDQTQEGASLIRDLLVQKCRGTNPEISRVQK